MYIKLTSVYLLIASLYDNTPNKLISSILNIKIQIFIGLLFTVMKCNRIVESKKSYSGSKTNSSCF